MPRSVLIGWDREKKTPLQTGTLQYLFSTIEHATEQRKRQQLLSPKPIQFFLLPFFIPQKNCTSFFFPQKIWRKKNWHRVKLLSNQRKKKRRTNLRQIFSIKRYTTYICTPFSNFPGCLFDLLLSRESRFLRECSCQMVSRGATPLPQRPHHPRGNKARPEGGQRDHRKTQRKEISPYHISTGKREWTEMQAESE